MFDWLACRIMLAAGAARPTICPNRFDAGGGKAIARMVGSL
jgi:hypothetical protein